ncbi:MAG: virulence protein SciE type, partial [Xanthomonas perforans]|nr:virulence protein SciE type [Xanthomonas perforans]
GEIGLGQRMWSTEARDVALLEVRDVQFDAD